MTCNSLEKQQIWMTVIGNLIRPCLVYLICFWNLNDRLLGWRSDVLRIRVEQEDSEARCLRVCNPPRQVPLAGGRIRSRFSHAAAAADFVVYERGRNKKLAYFDYCRRRSQAEPDSCHAGALSRFTVSRHFAVYFNYLGFVFRTWNPFKTCITCIMSHFCILNSSWVTFCVLFLKNSRISERELPLLKNNQLSCTAHHCEQSLPFLSARAN